MTTVLKLGVPEMDADHAHIVAMFEAVARLDDDRLAAAFDEIDAEIRAHFAREEALFDAANLPIAHCHKTQHALLLGELDAARPVVEAGDPATLRRLLGVIIPELVAGHVASVDQVTAQFLRGAMAAPAFDRLRLAEA